MQNYLTYALSIAGSRVEQRDGVLVFTVEGRTFAVITDGTITLRCFPDDIPFLVDVYDCVRRRQGCWITIDVGGGMSRGMVQRLISKSFGLAIDGE